MPCKSNKRKRAHRGKAIIHPKKRQIKYTGITKTYGKARKHTTTRYTEVRGKKSVSKSLTTKRRSIGRRTMRARKRGK